MIHRLKFKGLFMSSEDGFRLWMQGELIDFIDGHSIENRLQEIAMFSEKGDTLEIEVDSRGGDYKHGWIVRYAIQKLNKTVPVTMIGTGDIGSTASMVFMSVPISQRIVRRGATGFIHNPQIIAGGEAREHEQIAKILRDTESEMAAVYAKDMDISVDEAVKYMDESTIFSTQMMIKSGFAGEIFKEDLEEDYNIAAIWQKSCVDGACKIEAKQTEEDKFKNFINQL